MSPGSFPHSTTCIVVGSKVESAVDGSMDGGWRMEDAQAALSSRSCARRAFSFKDNDLVEIGS